MDLAALVRAVAGSFDEASKLVNRVREQRINSDHGALPKDPTNELLESLALGAITVRGNYDHGFRRFGEPYACGDSQAREQMKDVLISLQMTLITNLRIICMDEMDLDFFTIHNASDDCRVNAGVCLGQLSQRLSQTARAQAMYFQDRPSFSPLPMSARPLSPSLAHSSSRSTQSSDPFGPPHTPDLGIDQPTNINIDSITRPTVRDRDSSSSYGGSQLPYVWKPITAILQPETYNKQPYTESLPPPESDADGVRRPSSNVRTSEDQPLSTPPTSSPVTRHEHSSSSPRQKGIGADHESRLSSEVENFQLSSPKMTYLPTPPNGDSKTRFGPNDYSTMPEKQDYKYESTYDAQLQPEENKRITISPSTRAQISKFNTQEHVRYLQRNSRPPAAGMNRSQDPRQMQPQDRRDSANSTTSVVRKSENIGRLSCLSPVSSTDSTSSTQSPLTTLHVPVELPTPHGSASIVARKFGSIPRSSTSDSSIIAPIFSSSLNVPTERDLHGFCKGAFRLQIGLNKKAFTVANKPAGYTGLTTFWKCNKCNFEGPLFTSTIVEGKKRSKPEKCFDPSIRQSKTGGVRYRWSFLAKSHVTVKALPEGPLARKGCFGSFGCVFCCAEGGQRGWLNRTNTSSSNSGDALARSITSGSQAKTFGTPIFGNIDSFMEHLEMHRDEKWWPNAEMLARTKCVVGRDADDKDDWDINFIPESKELDSVENKI